MIHCTQLFTLPINWMLKDDPMVFSPCGGNICMATFLECLVSMSVLVVIYPICFVKCRILGITSAISFGRFLKITLCKFSIGGSRSTMKYGYVLDGFWTPLIIINNPAAHYPSIYLLLQSQSCQKLVLLKGFWL